ncbi:transcription termination factor MTERF4, chloroplastic [Syzygium oleosum]|uniref:transcription termination factor MTERF4, chloroplastic n=1 Tax=Syzygium oleosum TaxID=219896 RepID=UPI0024BAFF96|nr:transcription termination factor MTERF4, chloroplastic [Syzygium oleosum]XP_056168441.1 transcription termination factor MTERF4, chloroplastic [Syzygium oleosum]XP_056168442.1 transcription termination factor MTERF4, chloroplastic [Syzygium oleosum]XP_056168443.1 transcription termination factor MTERF4, chloroplastic [Syzygium oleosum]XP_056168444.1 transcription termination factor MTERF4, chloroplastic [Syzygium oleosum]
MRTFNSLCLFSVFRRLSLNPTKACTRCFSAESPDVRDGLSSFLMRSMNLSRSRALVVSNRCPWATSNSLENPRAVIKYFSELGFSDSQIRSSIIVCPQILFADIGKTLEPKLDFFQGLGLVGVDLGNYISKGASVLSVSLNKRLVPNVQILKRILFDDKDNRDLIVVLRRCKWIVSKDPESVLIRNIAYLESCGVTGYQQRMLLKRQPSLFVAKESRLNDLVSRVLKMGFSLNSGMLVYALYSVSCISVKTLGKKVKLFADFGFSEEDVVVMLRRAPALLRVSEEKLKFGIDFLLNVMKCKRTLIVGRPSCLMHSMEDRVVPRCRVLQVVKLRGLMKKDPSFTTMLELNEEAFVERFISRFIDDTDQLLIAYKGHILDV